MKKMFAAMTAALMMVALVSSVALAAPSKGAGTPFTASYVDGFGQTFTCTGTHVVNKNVVKDNETCLATGAGFVAGTYTGSPYGDLPPYPSPGYRTTSWRSDFPGTFYGTQATSWTITETANGDGTFTWGIAAIY